MSTSESRIKEGTRVRAKVATTEGWKGTGTVVEVRGGTIVKVLRDFQYDWCGIATFCPRELAVCRDQKMPELAAATYAYYKHHEKLEQLLEYAI
jgi:hypothetical protein